MVLRYLEGMRFHLNREAYWAEREVGYRAEGDILRAERCLRAAQDNARRAGQALGFHYRSEMWEDIARVIDRP